MSNNDKKELTKTELESKQLKDKEKKRKELQKELKAFAKSTKCRSPPPTEKTNLPQKSKNEKPNENITKTNQNITSKLSPTYTPLFDLEGFKITNSLTSEQIESLSNQNKQTPEHSEPNAEKPIPNQKDINESPPFQNNETKDTEFPDNNSHSKQTESSISPESSLKKGNFITFNIDYNIFEDNISVFKDSCTFSISNENKKISQHNVKDNIQKSFTEAKETELQNYHSLSNWSLSLNMAIPIKDITDLIKEYKGEEKGLNSFIKNIDKLWTHIENYDQGDKTRFLLVLQLKLTEKAADATKDVTFDNWTDVKKALKEKINPQKNVEKAELKLAAVKQQPNEEVEQFAKRVEDLMENLNKSFDLEGNNELIKKQNDRRAKKAFEDGLSNTELKNKAISRGTKSLRDSIDYVTEQELRQSEMKSITPEKFCKYCKATNHDINECHKLLRNKNLNSNSNLNSNPIQNSNPNTNQYSRLNHLPSTSRNNDVICFKCNKRGHYAPDCWAGGSSGGSSKPSNIPQNNNQPNHGANRGTNETRHVRLYDIDIPIEDALTYAEPKEQTKN